MRKMLTAASVLLLFGILSGLWSCHTPAGRSAGQVVDDATITTKVKAKLLEDPVVSGLAVSVETFEGTVTLTGAVDSIAQKQRAGDIARSVSDVRGVNNLLKTKAPGR